MLLEILLLAFASALWPLLMAVVVVALRSPRPEPLLLAFFAGGMLTTVTIGLAIVYSIKHSNFVEGPHPTADPVVYITAGCIAVIAGLVATRLGRRRTPKEAPPKKPSGSGWSERMLTHGTAVAFLGGVVVNIVPGVFPFVALKDIAQLDYGVAATVALVVGFYLVMFVLIEAPLVGYLFAPTRTQAAAESFNAWLSAHGREVAIGVVEVIGVYLIVRGIVAATL